MMINDPNEREEMVFEAAVQLPPEQRGEYLDGACAGEPGLRERVESLLGAFERGAGLLNEPVVSASAGIPILTLEKPGDVIGRYRLVRRMGEGGCGVVYLAEQLAPVKRNVALKVIKPGMDTKEVIARFEGERQALALMDHPNIARILDAGATETGRPYFVMELVHGPKITDYCGENKLSTRERLALFLQICQAVQHAHQKGVIHRDLKPSNILVTGREGAPVPKVIDFGIAKATTGRRLTDKTLFTAFDRFIGTPAYMSPEQAETSEADIDTRSDIYSLGVLLYELLTEKTPFDARELMASGIEAMRRIIREKEPPRPSTRLSQEIKGATAEMSRRGSEPVGKAGPPESRPPAPSPARSPTAPDNPRPDPRRNLEELQGLIRILRGDLDWIVMKCLEKDRSRRYETADGLAADLNRHLHHQPVEARPPSAAYRLKKAFRRNKPAFAAAAGVALALMAGTAVSVWQAARATKESGRAREAARRADASAYAANIRLAQFAWAQNSAGQVRQLLKETEEYPARGFEWFYWQRKAHLQLQTLRGQHGAVLAVAASRDDRWAATGGLDGTAKVWESGQLSRTLQPHGGPVSSAAFSPDGQRIVTGSWDRAVRVWETVSGRLLRTLKGHTGEVFSVAFSSDGRRILSGGLDRTARVWDASTGREEFALHGHAHWVWSAAFSNDDRWIVTGSQDGTAKVWDGTTGAELRTFTNHAGAIRSVALSPIDQRVVTAGKDLTARVWDLTNGRELVPPLKGHTDAVSSAAFSRDGGRLVTASYDRTARIWDAASGAELFTIRGHGSPLSSAVFSADGRRLITGGGSVGITPLARSVDGGFGDGTAKVWAVEDDQETLILRGHADKVMSVAFSPDSRRIVTGSYDKTAIVWDARGGKALFKLEGHEDRVRAVAYSPDGQRIATGSLEGAGKIWSATDGKLLAELKGHGDRILCAAFSPDGQRIVTGSGDQTARVWSAVDGRPLISLAGQEGWIFSAAFSPDGRRIVTGSNDGKVRICDANTGERLRVFTGNDWGIGGVAYSPDGKRILAGTGTGVARIWDAADATPLFLLTGHTFEIYSVAYSSDGQRVVTAGKDRKAKVWDAATGRELLTLAGHDDEIWSVAFSPDGRRIVTGSWDGAARVWEAATPEQVSRWRAEDETAEFR